MRLIEDPAAAWALECGHCPDCGYRGFVHGPQGGMATNIECGNLACRSRFNVTYFGGQVVMAHRLESRAEGGVEWPSEPGHMRQ